MSIRTRHESSTRRNAGIRERGTTGARMSPCHPARPGWYRVLVTQQSRPAARARSSAPTSSPLKSHQPTLPAAAGGRLAVVRRALARIEDPRGRTPKRLVAHHTAVLCRLVRGRYASACFKTADGCHAMDSHRPCRHSCYRGHCNLESRLLADVTRSFLAPVPTVRRQRLASVDLKP